MKYPSSFSEFTESKFRSLIEEIKEDKGTDKYQAALVVLFNLITEHPSGSDLFYYPVEGADWSNEGIFREIKKWRIENSLPGLKFGSGD